MVCLESGRGVSVQEPIQGLYQPSVVQLARQGYFRAIAYWLNTYLVSQGMFVKVAATPQPGYLKIVVELQRLPHRDRLIRFIGHRLCKLNSEVILGAHIVARLTHPGTILWQQSVRLLTPANQQNHIGLQPSSQPHQLDLHYTAKTIRRQLKHLQLRSSQLQASIQHPQIRLLAKSALAAFMVGCIVEAIHSTFIAIQEPQLASIEPGTRSSVVQTAVEKVNVVQLGDGASTDDAVTLTFNGSGALGAVSQQANLTQERGAAADRVSGDRAIDIALTNLDMFAPVEATSPGSAASPKDSPTILPTSSSASALRAGGINLVNLASAQLLRSGPTELTQTLHALEQAGIYTVGAGRNRREARRPEIFDVKGQRLAYLGYSDVDLTVTQAQDIQINSGMVKQVADDIRAIRPQVDWVIVNYQWTRDLMKYPDDWQMHLAHAAIDHGADLVVGHHPSKLQGTEIYKGRAIAYSLGNFIFDDQQAAPTDYDTAVLKVSLKPQQMRLEILPVQVRHAKPQIVAGQQKQELLQYLQEASRLFEQPMQPTTILQVRSPVSPATQQPGNTSPVTVPSVQASPSASVVSSTPVPAVSPSIKASPSPKIEPSTPTPSATSPAAEASPSPTEFPSTPSPVVSPVLETVPTIEAVSPSPSIPMLPFITYPGGAPPKQPVDKPIKDLASPSKVWPDATPSVVPTPEASSVGTPQSSDIEPEAEIPDTTVPNAHSTP